MSAAGYHHYLVALGSNMRLPGLGDPRSVCGAGFDALDRGPCRLLAASPIMRSVPLGPSQRLYANAAAIIETALSPPKMLAHLQAIERAFGRGRNQRRGQRWRARALDLDLILWSGGAWQSPGLTIPHPLFGTRRFVLEPASSIAGEWRDPVCGLALQHWLARLAKRENRLLGGRRDASRKPPGGASNQGHTGLLRELRAKPSALEPSLRSPHISRTRGRALLHRGTRREKARAALQ